MKKDGKRRRKGGFTLVELAVTLVIMSILFAIAVPNLLGYYKVTAENRNDFENTVEKSYTYEKSTTTSTTVSNTYSQNWTEETTIGVEFSVPVLAALSPTAKVEQSFSYSYGMEKTYESSKEESYAQSITDTISVPLPAHTALTSMSM